MGLPSAAVSLSPGFRPAFSAGLPFSTPCGNGCDFKGHQSDVALVFCDFTGFRRACGIDGADGLRARCRLNADGDFAGFEVEDDFGLRAAPVLDGNAVDGLYFVAALEAGAGGNGVGFDCADIGRSSVTPKEKLSPYSKTASARLVSGPAATMAMRLAGCCLSKA